MDGRGAGSVATSMLNAKDMPIIIALVQMSQSVRGSVQMKVVLNGRAQ